jgi:hypothetical protein
MRRLSMALVVLAAIGCAKETAPPPVPPSAPTASSAATDAAPAATAATAPAAPDAAAPAALAPEPAPDPDTCAPVAVAYEKSLRAKLKQCWLDAANKSKDKIIGSIRLILEIDGSGKVVGQRMAEKSDLPDPIQKCMMRAFKAEPIDSAKCDMKTFTIAEKFPR